MKIQDTGLITFEEALASSRRQMVERFSKYVNPIEARIFKLLNTDKRFVKAEGIRIFDEQGEEYLDFTAGYGALCLGHNPAEVLAAVQQAANLPTILSLWVSIRWSGPWLKTFTEFFQVTPIFLVLAVEEQRQLKRR